MRVLCPRDLVWSFRQMALRAKWVSIHPHSPTHVGHHHQLQTSPCDGYQPRISANKRSYRDGKHNNGQRHKIPVTAGFRSLDINVRGSSPMTRRAESHPGHACWNIGTTCYH
jgi:hypothetical protein